MIKNGASGAQLAVLLGWLSLLCATSACSSEASEARRKYEFLEGRRASYGEICDAAKAWKSAAANTQGEDYQDAEIAAMGACLSADMRGRDASSGDNMDAVADDVSGNGTAS